MDGSSDQKETEVSLHLCYKVWPSCPVGAFSVQTQWGTNNGMTDGSAASLPLYHWAWHTSFEISEMLPHLCIRGQCSQTKLMDFCYYCPREEILAGLMGWGQGCRQLWSEAILENSSVPDKCFFYSERETTLLQKEKEVQRVQFRWVDLQRGNVIFLLQCCPVACELNYFWSQSWYFTFWKNTSRLFLMQVQDFKELPESKLAELHQQ